MQSKVRDFYQLERLWSMDAPDSNDLAATAEHS
jgi:ribosomal silencing factor RsfS